jgi:hypothetical protein
MQVKTVHEKRVAIVRAAMIVAAENFTRFKAPGWVDRAVNADRRALAILMTTCACTEAVARRFVQAVMTKRLTVRRLLEMNLSEVPYV